MRAAQINEKGIVINFAEVDFFDEQFVDPKDSDIGSVYDSVSNSFTPPSIDKIKINKEILEELRDIDGRSIRAIREGDQERIAALESRAIALRMQLVKD